MVSRVPSMKPAPVVDAAGTEERVPGDWRASAERARRLFEPLIEHEQVRLEDGVKLPKAPSFRDNGGWRFARTVEQAAQPQQE